MAFRVPLNAGMYLQKLLPFGKHFLGIFPFFLMHHEIPDKGSQQQAVHGKGHQGHMAHQPHEGLDRDQGGNKGADHAHGKEGDVRRGEQMQALEQVKARGRHHDGHGGDERIFGRQRTAGPQDHAAHDGGRRTGKAGEQGQALEAADAEGQAGRHVVQGLIAGMELAALHKNHQQGADDEGDQHHARREQALNLGVQQQAQHTGGHAGEEEHPDAAQTGKGHALLRPQQAPEASPVEDDHGHDGAQLDDHLEGGSFFTAEIEQIAHQHQMARGRDRQVFRQPFHDAEDERNPQIIHICRPLDPKTRCFPKRTRLE